MLVFVRSLHEVTFIRYVLASAVALGFDVSVLAALVALGISAGTAATFSYAFGIGMHWLITSRAVFQDEVETGTLARTRQKVLFVLSAIAGMSVTSGIVSVGTGLGVHLALTKATAVGVSFTMSWLLRRWFVFRPRGGGLNAHRDCASRVRS